MDLITYYKQRDEKIIKLQKIAHDFAKEIFTMTKTMNECLDEIRDLKMDRDKEYYINNKKSF